MSGIPFDKSKQNSVKTQYDQSLCNDDNVFEVEFDFTSFQKRKLSPIHGVLS